MSDVSIKVTIAGRVYPLTVRAAEESGIRQAAQAIDESYAAFKESYAVKDRQDLLAMAALQVSARRPVQKEIERVVEKVEVPADISGDLLELEKMLDNYLGN